MNLPEEYSFLIFLVCAPVIWLFATTQLRNKMGMVKEISKDAGALIRQSGWGSANINGVSLQNCVKVLVYTNGYELRVMGLFGGGKLWLPKNNTAVVGAAEKSFFSEKKVTVQSGQNCVLLYGKLSTYV